MRRTLCCVAIVAALVTGSRISSELARACSLDGAPSLFADGQLDRINTQPPTTSAQLATWARFLFPRTYSASHDIVFTENRQEVAKSLVPAAMQRPWRWQFSDGSTESGWTVRHAFAHPGHWVISVDAYYPGDGKWYNFDQAAITITAAPHTQHH